MKKSQPKLIYVPLESYQSRYTQQWSAPKTGWLERRWIKAGINYIRIDPDQGKKNRVIKVGSVLDAVGRSTYSFSQIQELLYMAERGEITDKDVIYFDDFWTPGVEALKYTFHLMGLNPFMYAFLHAQSVDEFDFTRKMRPWIRSIEIGYGQIFDGIFTSCPTLRDKIVEGGIAGAKNVYALGHPICVEEMLSRCPKDYQNFINGKKVSKAVRNKYEQRSPSVVFSSRLDKEKNPHFFLDVMEKVQREDRLLDQPITKFIICSGNAEIKSNISGLKHRLLDLEKKNVNFELRLNLTKEQYYKILCESAVQFNCADQDFVAMTLYDALVCGCVPVYPNFRSFPEVWGNAGLHFCDVPKLYKHRDKDEAVCSIMNAIDTIHPRNWQSLDWIQDIHRDFLGHFDDVWEQMITVMNVDLFKKKYKRTHSHPDITVFEETIDLYGDSDY